MRSQYIHSVAVLLVSMTLASAHAANRYWVGSNRGNFSDSANWAKKDGGISGATVPGAKDIAHFNGAGTGDCLINVSIEVRGIVIKADYLGTVIQNEGVKIAVGNRHFSQAGGTFAGGGVEVSIKGSFLLSGGTFVSTGGVLVIGGNWTHTAGGTFDANFGTVRFVGRSRKVRVNGIEEFHNFEIHKNNDRLLTVVFGGAVLVRGALTHVDGKLDGLIEAHGNMRVKGTADGGAGSVTFVSSGDQYIVGDSGHTASILVNKSAGSLFLKNPDLTVENITLAAGELVSIRSNLNVLGNWVHTDVNATFNHGFGTVTFAGKSRTINVPSTETFNNLVIEKDDGRRLMIASGDTLAVSGDFTLLNGKIHRGTVAVEGDVHIAAEADGGNAKLLFFGSRDQTYANLGGNEPDGSVTVSKISGTITLATKMSLNGRNQRLRVMSGELDLAGNDLLVAGVFSVEASGTVTLLGDESVTYGAFSPLAGSTVEYTGTGNYPSLAVGYNYHHLSFSGAGTWQLAGLLDVDGNLSVAKSTLDGAENDMRLAGDWLKGDQATITRVRSLILDGQDQAISGNNTFDRLSKIASISSTLSFESEKLQTITGSMTLTGVEGARLRLRSSNEGVRWLLDPQGIRKVLYLDVKDSGNRNEQIIQASATSIDSGNNVGWEFASFVWSGAGANRAWETASNWFGAVVPAGGITAIFNSLGSKSCVVRANAQVKRIEVTAEYAGDVSLGSGVIIETDSMLLDGIFRMGSNSKLILAGEVVPLRGSGILDTTTNEPNTVEYAGAGNIDLTSDSAFGNYYNLFLNPPKGMSRIDTIYGGPGDTYYDSIAIDEKAGFLYVGTKTSPARVVKIRLTDFTKVATITLAQGENDLYPSVIDSSNGFLYVGCRTYPAKVVKIRLSDFTRVQTLEFPAGDDRVESAVIDSANGYAYWGTKTVPGRIIRVDLASFTYAGTIVGNPGEDWFTSATIDTVGGNAYFGAQTVPGKIVRVRLSDFTKNGTLTLDAGEDNVRCAVCDPANGYAYFGLKTEPGIVAKVRLSDFKRTDALTLNDGENMLYTAVIDPAKGLAYFGTYTNPGLLVKIDLSNFTRNDVAGMGTNERDLWASAIDIEKNLAYIVTDNWLGRVLKVNLKSKNTSWRQTAPLTVKGDLTIGTGTFRSQSHNVSVSGDWLNTGRYIGGQNTVTLNGNDQAVTGDNEFHNLSKAASASWTLSFQADRTQTVSGLLDLRGPAGQLLRLRSSKIGETWRLNAAQHQTVRYADIQDTDASRGRSVIALDSVDGGDNLNVIFSQSGGLTITTPAKSTTSPAWVEGTNYGDAAEIKVAVNGGTPFESVRLAPTKWFGDNASSSGSSFGVTLSWEKPTNLEVIATNKFGNAGTVAQTITWTPTDLSQTSFSTDSIRIRNGDSLLLTSTGTGAILEIDGNDDGTYEHSGAPGDVFPVTFSTAGSQVAQAKIDGKPVGSITIVVVDVDLNGPIAAEVYYQREKDVIVSPATEAGYVSFVPADKFWLGVSVKQTTSKGARLYLKPLRRGAPVLEARLEKDNGPLLAYREITEFTREVAAMWSTLVNGETEVGTTPVTMRPYVPNVRWDFRMFAATSTFAGGVTHMSVNTSDQDPATGETLFKQVYDPATGETIGEYLLDIEVPEGEDKYCFLAGVYQPNAPVQASRSAQIFVASRGTSDEVLISRLEMVNGRACIALVRPIAVCYGGTETLNLIRLTGGFSGDKLDVTLRYPAASRPRFATPISPRGQFQDDRRKISNWFSCNLFDQATHSVVVNANPPIFSLDPSGYYDVYIGTTRFPKAVTVIRIRALTVSPTAICAGTGTAEATATIQPSDRSITWSIQGNENGCTIDSNGLITQSEKTTAGSITIRAEDSEFSDCYAEVELVLVGIGPVTINPPVINIAETDVAHAGAETTPLGRTIIWSLTKTGSGGASINEATGDITAGDNAEIVTVRAADSLVPSCFSQVELPIVKVDLDGDANNDGSINEADETVEVTAPGVILGVKQINDSAYKATKIKLKVEALGLGSTVQLIAAAGAKHVSLVNAKSNTVSLPATFNIESLPDSLWVSGISQGQTRLALILKGPNDENIAQDDILITVFDVSIKNIRNQTIGGRILLDPSFVGLNDTVRFEGQIQPNIVSGKLNAKWQYRKSLGGAWSFFKNSKLIMDSKATTAGDYYVRLMVETSQGTTASYSELRQIIVFEPVVKRIINDSPVRTLKDGDTIIVLSTNAFTGTVYPETASETVTVKWEYAPNGTPKNSPDWKTFGTKLSPTVKASLVGHWDIRLSATASGSTAFSNVRDFIVANVRVAFGESQRGNRYGYDDMNTGDSFDDHVSLKNLGSITKVTVTVAGAPSGADIHFSSLDSKVVSSVKTPASTPSAGFDITLTGGSTNKGQTDIEARWINQSGPLLGRFHANVYQEKVIGTWHIYRCTDPASPGTSPVRNVDPGAIRTSANDIVKQAVIKFQSATSKAVSIGYDANGNGALDWYYDKGAQPEHDIIKAAALAGNPKIVIVRNVNFTYRLSDAAALGSVKIRLRGIELFWAGTYTLGTGVNRESVNVVNWDKNSRFVGLTTPLRFNHAANEELVWTLAAGVSADPQVVQDGAVAHKTAIHETLHRTTNLLDVLSPPNIMNWQVLRMPQPELRFLPLAKKYNSGTENQWEKVTRP